MNYRKKLLKDTKKTEMTISSILTILFMITMIGIFNMNLEKEEIRSEFTNQMFTSLLFNKVSSNDEPLIVKIPDKDPEAGFEIMNHRKHDLLVKEGVIEKRALLVDREIKLSTSPNKAKKKNAPINDINNIQLPKNHKHIKKTDVGQYIWNFLKNKGFTDAGVAGVMGNLYAESGLTAMSVENAFEYKVGNDLTYTQNVDSGKYSKDAFIYDKVGYGLAGWTWHTKKRALYDLAKERGKSIGDLDVQLELLHNEFLYNYPQIYKLLTTSNDILVCSNKVLLDFEKPYDMSYRVQIKRASFGKLMYNYYK